MGILEKKENLFCNVEEQRPIRLVREVRLNPGMDAQKNRIRFLLFCGASLALHALLMLSLFLAPAPSELLPPKAVFVDLNALPPTQAQQKDAPKQVVESEATKQQAEPKDAKYLGERNQVADQETKARNVDIFRQGGAATQAGNRGQGLSLKDLAPSKSLAPPTAAEIDGFQRERERVARAESARPGDRPTDNAGSANNDYLKDVKEGDRTMLSTKEFVYFGYYRRIRERLEVAWNSRLRSAMESYMVGGRNLAQNQNYVTGVVVVLDRNGQITAVQLMQKSGAKDLDQAAVDAFNEAGPFPDPPSGLVDENGEIKIPWNFILQS
jgi:TonB family protein